MDEACTLNVRGGARLAVPAALNQLSTNILLEQEDWFEDEIRFVRRWLRPGMQAVDVGANIGVYTVAMAHAVGAGGRVWAFEPTPYPADFLEHSIGLNGFGNVVLSRSAVSDRQGSLAFSAGRHAELNAVATPENAAGADLLNVNAVTLDGAAAAQVWKDIDLLKLDVEGHELEAVQGGAGFLGAQSPLVMFEIKADETVDLRALGPLAQLGYQFYRLLPGPLWLVPFDPEGADSNDLLNAFACKPERAASLAALGLLTHEAADTGTPSALSWNAYLDRLPYAKSLAANWPSSAGFLSGGGLAIYLEGLAAYAHSRGEDRPTAERHAWLCHAFRCLAEALDAAPSLARLVSYGRLARELGMREPAFRAFEAAAGRLETEWQAALAEPFLAPSERYERLTTATGARDWLKCGVVEQLEKTRTYSSVFAGASSLEVLAPIRGLPQWSAEMERRWQLARMRHGLQSGPEPAAVLRERTEENLNPQFWCAGAAT
ncbi:MAG: FkbM family methyltransferase [Candidatus Parcubacteria bacterium]|nr:FkbM family methyltransferase [Burkholderiales bacterium]